MATNSAGASREQERNPPGDAGGSAFEDLEELPLVARRERRIMAALPLPLQPIVIAEAT
jgi:hypothetical protein